MANRIKLIVVPIHEKYSEYFRKYLAIRQHRFSDDNQEFKIYKSHGPRSSYQLYKTQFRKIHCWYCYQSFIYNITPM